MEIERGVGKIAKCLRVMLYHKPGHLAKVTSVIAEMKASIGDIRLVRVGRTHNTREIVVFVASEDQLEELVDALSNLSGIIVEESLILFIRCMKAAKLRQKAVSP